ncbi:hypothetical protein CDAR_596261 [Caerostris darwini]|uniref:Ribosomal protein eL8/eL30/eS12/Gadd45 domain-containing protein n=1 Tax=Caerostris darwini TaxID=1538125 RepID=A0AAV4UXA2_9ARAC|nr:hypothetical protein CDAR_596261 [Caerostris darwini]
MGKKNKRKLDDFVYQKPKSQEYLFDNIIKEFSSVRKSNGLVVGTNEILRYLEKNKLAAVFLYSAKVSPPIYHSISQWCKVADIPFIILQEKHNNILGSQFPKSLTYGIKVRIYQKLIL